MVRWLVAGLVLTGCYSPTYAPGSACDSACPGNLVCVAHVCRVPGASDAAVDVTGGASDGPSIDGPPGDRDGDGVKDDVDNCPNKANPNQHDEDGDSIGDVCDPCPHLAGSAADSDGDGVGDACDPQPTIAKQTLAFFDPFTSQLAAWDASSLQQATIGGDHFEMGAGNADSAFARLVVANAETRFYAGGRVLSCSGANVGPHELAISFSVNGSNYYYVQAYDTDGTDGYLQIMQASGGGTTFTGLAGTAYTGVLPVGAFLFQVDESVAAKTLAFRSTLGGVSRMTLAATATMDPLLSAGASFGFFTRNCDVRFDYFVVVQTVP